MEELLNGLDDNIKDELTKDFDCGPEEQTTQTQTYGGGDPQIPAATVKFLIAGTQSVVTKACDLTCRISDLKEQLADEFNMEANMIIIRDQHVGLEESDQLFALGIEQHQTHQFIVESADPQNHPLVLRQVPRFIPDVITVKIPKSRLKIYAKLA